LIKEISEFTHKLDSYAVPRKENPRAEIEQTTLPPLERWVIAQQTAVDVGADHKKLGYALLPGYEPFDSAEKAMDALKAANLPVGWVVLPFQHLFPKVLPGEQLALVSTVRPVTQWQARTFDGTEWTPWANCTKDLVLRYRTDSNFEFRGLLNICSIRPKAGIDDSGKLLWRRPGQRETDPAKDEKEGKSDATPT
jgi:hypothetical protein